MMSFNDTGDHGKCGASSSTSPKRMKGSTKATYSKRVWADSAWRVKACTEQDSVLQAQQLVVARTDRAERVKPEGEGITSAGRATRLANKVMGACRNLRVTSSNNRHMPVLTPAKQIGSCHYLGELVLPKEVTHDHV